MKIVQKIASKFESKRMKILRQQVTQLQQQILQIQQQGARLEENLREHCADQRNDHWITKFGYDSLIANLQLAVVENICPGNRDRLTALQNTHKGETCFVIGNGPSLKAEDLTKLYEKGMFCLGSKRITAIFEDTPWRPDVWGVSDLDFIQLYHEEMSQLSGFQKLAPCQSIINLNISIKDAIYFPFIQAERTPCWFNADITRGVHFWGTITCKLINFAVYMGFTKIYLLGVDHSVPIVVDKDGKKRYDTSQESHFSSKYYDNQKDFEKAIKNVDDIEKSMDYVAKAYKDVKYNCDALGVEIYNATRGGELEVFPRVDFDMLFEGL